MSEKNLSDYIDEAVSMLEEMGSRAGEAIRGFSESDACEGIKKGAKTAASGIAEGAKRAAGGIKEGTHVAHESMKKGSGGSSGARPLKKYVRLSNGVEIPFVGYGSYLSTAGNGKQTILDALDAGYRYIDTARFYHNEAEIGEALRESGIPRDDIFLCSKVWPDMLGREKLMESFEASCTDLKTCYLNMYLIHWPKVSQSDEEWVEKIRESWETMEELYRQGRIRAIGLSNFLPHHIRPLLETAKIRPMLDQLELHVGYMQEYARQYLKKERIVVQAWSPLGRGVLMNDERIARLAEKYEKTNAQIMLRYLIQRGIPAIPKTTSPQRMKENMDVFDFSLTSDEISYLSCIPETGWSTEHPDTMEWPPKE